MKHLFQHSLIENLFRQVVSQSIEGFTERLKTLTTSAPQSVSKGFSALRGLRDKAMKQTPLSSIASIWNYFVIKEYVDRSIDTLQQATEQLSHPSNKKNHASYRLHVWIRYWIQISSVAKEEGGHESLVASLRDYSRNVAKMILMKGSRVYQVFVVVGERACNNWLTKLAYTWLEKWHRKSDAKSPRYLYRTHVWKLFGYSFATRRWIKDMALKKGSSIRLTWNRKQNHGVSDSETEERNAENRYLLTESDSEVKGLHPQIFHLIW